MTKGLSLHIGMNVVDPGHYGSSLPLTGAVPDARAMQKLAAGLGYQTTTLLDDEGTTGNVVRKVVDAAGSLGSGDIFMLTYAGHGSQVFDRTGDETDGFDETWCLYDRMLLDDEIFRLLSYFEAGVRVLLVSDSCHAGTVARKALSTELVSAATGFRGLAREAAAEIAEKFDSTYTTAKLMSLRSEAAQPRASIELLAACQDNQLAQDWGTNGFFTINLLNVWDKGKFTGTHPQFFRQIRDQMPPTQTPNRMSLGPAHTKFQTGKPFEI